MLEDGHVLAVSPGRVARRSSIRGNPLLRSGGVREALFGDHNYHLIWKERRGFAKVAIEAKTVRERMSLSTNGDCRLGHHSHVHQELP